MTDNGSNHQHIAKGSMLDAHNTPQSRMRDADKPIGVSLNVLDAKKRSDIRLAYLAKYGSNGLTDAINNYPAFEKTFTQKHRRFPTIAEYIESLVK